MRCTIFLGFLFVGLCLADLPEIPDLDDLEDLKDRCNTKGGPGTFDKVKAAKTESETCFKKLIDIEKFKNEIEEAKKTGSMDEVFAKYCNKRPELKDCLMKTYDALKPCLEENEKQAINFTADILKQLSDFACFKDGDRIAMFVAEGGVECIKSRAEGIKNCFNETIKFNPNSFSPDTFSDLKINKKKCNDMKTIQNCIVKDLEDNCDETTPANIVDALFRFVNKIACKNIKERRSISLKRHLRSTLMQNQEMIKTELVSKIRDMCKKNGDEKSFEKLMESFNGVMGCSGNHRLFVTPVNTFEEELVRCTEPVRLASLGCLADSEKYYPDFVLQSLRNLLRFLYANSDKIRGKTIDWEFATCMKDITRDEKRKQMMKCFEDKNNGEIFVIPPKAELCQKTKEFDSCMYDIIKNTCIKDISIHKFFEDFIKAIESPCTEITSERESQFKKNYT